MIGPGQSAKQRGCGAAIALALGAASLGTASVAGADGEPSAEVADLVSEIEAQREEIEAVRERRAEVEREIEALREEIEARSAVIRRLNEEVDAAAER